MTKITKTNAFKTVNAKPETTMDKTSRIARRMIHEAAEVRHQKISRLRKARLEREANTPTETTPTTGRKKRGS